MPVSPFSRYRNLPTLDIVHASRGRTRSLPIRRPSPSPTTFLGGRQHRFGAYESADLLALRYFGREDLYWHVLDANGVKLPDGLEAGEILQIPPLSTATQIELPGR